MTLRKVNFSIFTVFSNHLAFLENYPPNSEIWVSIGGTGCGELTCYSGYAQFFSEKSYDSQKSQFYEFLTVFGNLLILLKKYPSKI